MRKTRSQTSSNNDATYDVSSEEDEDVDVHMDFFGITLKKVKFNLEKRSTENWRVFHGIFATIAKRGSQK